MVIVPSFCPDVPALRKNPVFLYSEDDFQKPNPFAARRRRADRPGVRPEGRLRSTRSSRSSTSGTPGSPATSTRSPRARPSGWPGPATGAEQALRRRWPIGSARKLVELLGAGAGQGRQVRRGVRGLRVRLAAVARTSSAGSSRSSREVTLPRRKTSPRADAKRRPGPVARSGLNRASASAQRRPVTRSISGGVAATGGPPQRRRWSLSM